MALPFFDEIQIGGCRVASTPERALFTSMEPETIIKQKRLSEESLFVRKNYMSKGSMPRTG